MPRCAKLVTTAKWLPWNKRHWLKTTQILMIVLITNCLHDWCNSQAVHDYMMKFDNNNTSILVKFRNDDELDEWTFHVKLNTLLLAHVLTNLLIRFDSINNLYKRWFVFCPFFICQLFQPLHSQEANKFMPQSL